MSEHSGPWDLAAQLSQILQDNAERLRQGESCDLAKLSAAVERVRQAWTAVCGDLSPEILDPAAWLARSEQNKDRQNAFEKMQWAQNLLHAGDSDFQPLRSLAARAQEAMVQLDATAEPASVALPFTQLHALVTSLRELTDDQIEELRAAVSAAFGAPLAIAAIRGNLRHSESVPEILKPVELVRSPEAEDASPGLTNEVSIQSTIEPEVATAPVPKPVTAEAITGVKILKVVASTPDPGLPPSSESEISPDEADSLALDPDAAAWRALAQGRASLAFHIARSHQVDALLNRDLLLVPEVRLTAELSTSNGHVPPLDALLSAVAAGQVSQQEQQQLEASISAIAPEATEAIDLLEAKLADGERQLSELVKAAYGYAKGRLESEDLKELRTDSLPTPAPAMRRGLPSRALSPGSVSPSGAKSRHRLAPTKSCLSARSSHALSQSVST
jgi:hypothetical protein